MQNKKSILSRNKWFRRLSLSYLLLAAGSIAGASGVATGTFQSPTSITSTNGDTNNKITGSYTTPSGKTGTYTIERTYYSGYLPRPVYAYGSSGISAFNQQLSNNPATIGNDHFTYQITLAPSSGLAASVNIQVVQAAYADLSTFPNPPTVTSLSGNDDQGSWSAGTVYGGGGNSEPARMTFDQVATVKANPSVSMYSVADGNQIDDQGGAVGSNAGATAPQLRRGDTSPALVYGLNAAPYSLQTPLTALQYPALVVGSTIPAKTAIEQFGAYNATSKGGSGYVLTFSGVNTLTVDYVANMQGTSAFDSNPYGETSREWISFGVADAAGINLKVAKTWAAGSRAGDTATVTTTGFSTNPTSGSSTATAAGNTTTGSQVTVYGGETGQLTETGAKVAAYTQTYACTGGATVDTSGKVSIPTTLAIGTNVTCTITNTPIAPTVKVAKNSVNGTGTFNFSLIGVTNTSDSVTTTASGTTVTSSTTHTGTIGTAASVTETAAPGYTTTYSCTDSNSAITGNATAVTGSGLTANIPAANMNAGAAWVCTFTNTRQSATLQLVKSWTNGKSGDIASIGATTNNGLSSNTSAFTATAPNGGNSGTAVTVYVGDTITLPAETMTTGSLSNYTTNLSCTVAGTAASSTPSGTNGQTSNTLQIAAGDAGKAIVCTYNNSRIAQSLNLAKTWSGGITNQTATATTTGGTNNATFTSTAPTNTTGSAVTVYAGDTVTLPAETYGGGATAAMYTTVVSCSGGSPLASGATGRTLTIGNTTTATTCTYSNTLNTTNVTITKNITGAPAGGAPGNYPFTLTCNTGTYNGSVTVASGAITGSTTVSVPVGATCTTLTEGTLPTAPSNYSWGTPSYTLPTNPIAAGASGTITNTLVGSPILSIAKSGPSSATIGTPYNYTLTVTNTGTAASSSTITVTDTIPAGLTIGALPAGCTASAQVVTCTSTTSLTTSAPGNALSLSISVTPTASLANTSVNNSASLTGGGSSCTTSAPCNSNTVTTTIGGTPGLSTNKSVNTQYVKVTANPNNFSTAALASSQLTPAQLVYSVTVKNTGSTSLSNVSVIDTLQAGLTYATGSTTGAAEPTVSGQQLTFTVPSLAIGASQTIQFSVNVAMNANTNESAFLNTATASAGGLSSTSNQVRTDVLYAKLLKHVHNLGSNPAVGVPQSSPVWVNTGTGLPGEVLEYCIDFNNYGSVPLSNYVLSDLVPANTTYVAGSAVVLSGTMTTPGATYPNGTVSYDAPSNTVLTNALSVPMQSSGTMCFRTKIN